MCKSRLQELEETIKELSVYRERLKKEVTIISKKLRIPESKINKNIANNIELDKISLVIEKLLEEKEKEISKN
tara:strand:- start:8098 stop:8316 length:219 start_codon:yes stop_codon:yes gene_type:complete